MNVVLYTHSKKYNSTSRSSGGASFACVLKSSSGKMHPHIELSAADPTAYNYAYIPAYGRYYYVQDWVFEQGLWSAELEVDVLASFKSEIGASTLYVLRSSAEYDSGVVDNMYPIVSGGLTVLQTANTGWTRQYPSGCYVLGVVSKSAASGAVAYYVLSYSQMAAFRNALMSVTDVPAWGADWSQITDFTGDVAKSMINPFQYVVSCTWFPFQVAGGGSVGISFGYWDSGVSAQVLNQSVQADTFQFSVPQQFVGQPDEWRRVGPYAAYTFKCMPFGTVTLDNNKVSNSAYIAVNVATDCITGLASCTILNDQGETLASMGAQLGIPVQLAQISTNYAGMVQSMANTAGGIAGNLLSGNIAGAITGGISGVISAAQAAVPQVATSGSMGGVGGISPVAEFVAYYRNVADYDKDNLGQPLCKPKLISSIPGYIMVHNGSAVSCGATREERNEIKSFLETGFYYE